VKHSHPRDEGGIEDEVQGIAEGRIGDLAADQDEVVVEIARGPGSQTDGDQHPGRSVVRHASGTQRDRARGADHQRAVGPVCNSGVEVGAEVENEREQLQRHDRGRHAHGQATAAEPCMRAVHRKLRIGLHTHASA
jgi:hypothetical protein